MLLCIDPSLLSGCVARRWSLTGELSLVTFTITFLHSSTVPFMYFVRVPFKHRIGSVSVRFRCRCARCGGLYRYRTWPGSTNERRSCSARGPAVSWKCSHAHSTSAGSRPRRERSRCSADRRRRGARSPCRRRRMPESSGRRRGRRATAGVATDRPGSEIIGRAPANHCLQNTASNTVIQWVV